MRKRPAVVLGITGGTGAGKTTLAREVCHVLGLGKAVIIHQDAYYFDRSMFPAENRARWNFDHPSALDLGLLKSHLKALRCGRAARIPTYNFHTHSRMPETVRIAPHPVVVVEGILLFEDTELRDLFDLRVYVDTDADLRFIRRLERDLRERGRSLESIVDQYLTTVRPMHLQFVEPSKRHADIIVPEGGHDRAGLETIVGRIRAMIESHHRQGA